MAIFSPRALSIQHGEPHRKEIIMTKISVPAKASRLDRLKSATSFCLRLSLFAATVICIFGMNSAMHVFPSIELSDGAASTLVGFSFATVYFLILSLTLAAITLICMLFRYGRNRTSGVSSTETELRNRGRSRISRIYRIFSTVTGIVGTCGFVFLAYAVNTPTATSPLPSDTMHVIYRIYLSVTAAAVVITVLLAIAALITWAAGSSARKEAAV